MTCSSRRRSAPRDTGPLSRFGPILATSLALLAVPSISPAIELRDPVVVSGSAAALDNQAGTIRLEQPRLGGAGPVTFVPEPGVLGQLAAGCVLLFALAGLRRAVGGATDRAMGARVGAITGRRTR